MFRTPGIARSVANAVPPVPPRPRVSPSPRVSRLVTCGNEEAEPRAEPAWRAWPKPSRARVGAPLPGATRRAHRDRTSHSTSPSIAICKASRSGTSLGRRGAPRDACMATFTEHPGVVQPRDAAASRARTSRFRSRAPPDESTARTAPNRACGEGRPRHRRQGVCGRSPWPNRTSNPGRGSGCRRTCPMRCKQRARPLVVRRANEHIEVGERPEARLCIHSVRHRRPLQHSERDVFRVEGLGQPHELLLDREAPRHRLAVRGGAAPKLAHPSA